MMTNCTLQLESSFESNFTMNCSEAWSNNNTESITPLPRGTAALIPFFVCLLIIAIASNIILMALVFKACKVNNSINIYLSSLSIGGLLQSFNIMLLLGLIIARVWVFGTAMCIINKLILLMTNSMLQFLHLIISRDRYKAIKNPLTSHQKTKQAYKYTTVLWMGISILGILLIIGDIQNPPNPGVDGDTLICFGWSNRLSRFNIFSILLHLAIVIIVAAIAFGTLGHYILIIRELRAVDKHRAEFKRSQTSPLATQVLKVNGKDKPLYTTAEERTAKSLTVLYLLQFICTSISNITAFILVTFYSTSDIDASKDIDVIETFNISIILLLAVYFIPTANPAILIFANKKFRKRVIGLLKCELRPHIEDDEAQSHFIPNEENIIARSISNLKLFVTGSTQKLQRMPSTSHSHRMSM